MNQFGHDLMQAMIEAADSAEGEKRRRDGCTLSKNFMMNEWKGVGL